MINAISHQAADPVFDSLHRWSPRDIPTGEVAVATTLAAMDQGGVDHALISARVAPRNVMISNDEVAAFVAQSRGRFSELGVPFCTQIGHTGPLMPSEVGRSIHLDQMALDFPEFVIVGRRIGYPRTDEAIAVATRHVIP